MSRLVSGPVELRPSGRDACGYIFAAGDEDLARKRKLAMARFELVLGPIAALGGIIAFLLEAGAARPVRFQGFSLSPQGYSYSVE